MKFWVQFKKKDQPQGYDEYTREKSQYSKPDEMDEADSTGTSGQLNKPANSDALDKLYEDQEVKAKMEAELAQGGDTKKESFQSLLGNGATTLGRSIKKVSSGQGVLDDDKENK